MAYVILRIGVRERTEGRFAFLRAYAHVRVLLRVSEGRVNLSLCARQLARGI